VAMSEGEIAVSLGGIVAPLLVGGLASTVLTWRFGLVIGGGVTAVAVLAMWSAPVPAQEHPAAPASSGPAPARRIGPSFQPTLIIVFAIVALEFSLSFWLASYLNDSVGIPRDLAAVMVSALYAANLVGRLAASRLARRAAPERVLGASFVVALAGLPILLAAGGPAAGATGIALVGVGIGAMFPLTSSLHVRTSRRGADAAMGQVLGVASAGQVLGPVAVGAIGQAAGLRVGLLVLPALVGLAIGALALGRMPKG
jgi:fucose permease